MGSLFRQAKVVTPSTISGTQEGALARLIAQLENSSSDESRSALFERLLGATSVDTQETTERIFTDALLRPALREFDREIAPRISSGFAGIGGTLSSRRGDTMARALGDVYGNVQSSIANLLPTIQNQPLQQALAQIEGFSALESARLAPLGLLGSLATAQTRTAAQQPAGPGWSLLNSALGAGGFAAGAYLGR